MAVNKIVADFLVLLDQAQAVRVESPLLTDWEVYEATGDDDNVIVEFTWTDAGKSWSVSLTEGGVSRGKWMHSTFVCANSDGNGQEIDLYKLNPILPGSA